MYKLRQNDVGDGSVEWELETNEDDMKTCNLCGTEVKTGYFCKEERCVFCEDCEATDKKRCDIYLQLNKYGNRDHWHVKCRVIKK